MRLAHIQLNTVLQIEPGGICSLVIENRRFFREMLADIAKQLDGADGASVLSQGDKIIPLSKNAELLTDFVTFNINTKSLQSKILAALEKSAVDGQHYLECMELLNRLEEFVLDLTRDYTADITCGKLNIGAVLKSIGVSVNDDYPDPLERLLDYMELVREFDRDKLFIFVNLRAYFDDEELRPFFDTVMAHEYHILLLDSVAAELLPRERRLTVDCDLCEF